MAAKHGRQVLAELRDRLKGSPYAAVRCIACDTHEGRIVLQGRVPSYYLKQVVLGIAVQLQGAIEIDDRIEVDVENDMPRDRSHCDGSCKIAAAEAGRSVAYRCSWASVSCSQDPFDVARLRDAAEDGDVCAMYRYGRSRGDPDVKRRWLRNAARRGCVPAIHEYGLESDDPLEAVHWLREAAEEGYVPAILDYARIREASSPFATRN